MSSVVLLMTLVRTGKVEHKRVHCEATVSWTLYKVKAVNVAARLPRYTKDHPCSRHCTEAVFLCFQKGIRITQGRLRCTTNFRSTEHGYYDFL